MPSLSQGQTVRVGIALDGPTGPDVALRASLEKEVRRLTSGRHEVLFPPELQIVGDWSAAAARQNVDSLLADAGVDVALVLGVVGPAYAARKPEIPKPVVAAAVLDPEFEGVPVEVRSRPLPGKPGVERIRVSGVTNLSYVSYNQDLAREVATFREIAPFTHLVILRMEGWLDEFAQMQERATDTLLELGVEATFLPIGRSIDAALAGLPAATEAVMLSAMTHLSDNEFDYLLASLHQRKLPTYSLWGQRDVRRGVMASLTADRNELFLVRRVALNLFNILQGQDAGEMPIDFSVDEQLTINMSTARSVGVDPTFALLTEAQLVGETEFPYSRRVSLATVVQEAADLNLDLIAAERSVEAGFRLVREARSALLPQASVLASSSFIDKDRASLFQPQRQVAGSLGISQLIYSEQARSGYDIERQVQRSREEERFQLRLDIMLEAAQSYLDVLRARTIESIQRTNLALTRSNTSLARARVDVGAARRDELLRWRSQIAQDRRRVIDASAQRSQAEIAVNRVLNRPLEESFETVEADLDDPELTVNFERFRPFVESPGSFKVFREFMTREAFDGSPELRQLDAAIRAHQRVLLASKRAFYIPNVGVNAQLQTFKNSGEPSPVPVVGPNHLNWMVGVSASLPLFQGGLLRYQRTRAELELDRLTTEREAARLLVEQRIRSALHQAGASFAGIELAEEAAAAARENLELVRDSYSEGFVSIVRLLDAQSQALSVQLEAANAIFDHLIDLMATQRATGRFDYFRSPEEREAFIRRLESYFQERGHAVRNN
ncbi:MAG: TolC family protein [Bryobacterales bacterium]|nr:TolC family protein [Bryobacterales bacterium]